MKDQRGKKGKSGICISLKGDLYNFNSLLLPRLRSEDF